MNRERFTKLFNEELAILLQNGVEKNVAAAKAISKAKQMIADEESSKSSVKCDLSKEFQKLQVKPEHVAKHIDSLPPHVEIVLLKVNSGIIEDMLKECSTIGSYSSVIRLCGKFYSSSEQLNSGFDIVGEIISEKLSTDVGIVRANVIEIEAIYNLLFAPNIEGIRNSIEYALISLSSNLVFTSKNIVKIHEVTQIIVMLEHPLILEPDYKLLLKNVLSIIDNLSETVQRSLSIWFGTIGKIVSIIFYYIYALILKS